MPYFKYKALRKEDNTSYEDVVETRDRFEVYGLVRKEGGQVLSVSEVKGGKSGMLQNDIGSLFSRINDADKVLFCRNLGAMLNAGLSVTRALNVIERQSRKAKLKAVVTELIRNIEQGEALSASMAKHPKVFSNLVVSMVRAGEESGNLAESLKTISQQLERVLTLKKKIKGAMMYPSIILFALVIVGALMLIFIVPTLTETFTSMEVELPMTTQVVIGLSNFLTAHTLLAFLILIGVIAAIVLALRTEAGKRAFESVFLRIPVLGTLMRETNSARTGRTLSSLLSSGVSMLNAIEITRDVIQNRHFRVILDGAKVQVQQGKPLAQVFLDAEKLYPPLVGELIAVGEETGALPDMLKEVAAYYEREVSQKTKNMSTIIEPILMLLVGSAVGFFAVSMKVPSTALPQVLCSMIR